MPLMQLSSIMIRILQHVSHLIHVVPRAQHLAYTPHISTKCLSDWQPYLHSGITGNATDHEYHDKKFLPFQIKFKVQRICLNKTYQRYNNNRVKMLAPLFIYNHKIAFLAVNILVQETFDNIYRLFHCKK